MILPGLNGFFSNVPSMVIGWNQLIQHARVGDGHFVCGRYFVIQDLSDGANPTGFHALECPVASKDKFPFGFVLGWFDPDGVAVDMVEDHLVLKTPAGDMWKLTSLIGVQCVSGVVGLDVYVLLLW